MIHLLFPLWLAAGAALLIPVIIHLWNKGQGKKIRIGSIFLLAEAESSRMRKPVLSQPWLLLLRCLLLILLSVALARPFIETIVKAPAPERWILVQTRDYKAMHGQFKPLIDSFTRFGYSLHAFDTGFPVLDTTSVAAHPSPLNQNAKPYWSLLRELDQLPSPPAEVALFTYNRLSLFTGIRPALKFRVHWNILKGIDTASTWNEGAYTSSEGRIHTQTGHSSAKATWYSSTILSDSRLPSDTSTDHIAVYYDADKRSDAGYVLAAIHAYKEYSGHKITLTSMALSAENLHRLPPSTTCTHIIWLSWSKIPLSIFDSTGIHQPGLKALLKYQNSSTLISSHASSLVGVENAESYGFSQQTDLFKYYRSAGNGHEFIWADHYEDPVLTIQPLSKLRVYRFYSRFDPAWSELVWTSGFPAFISQFLREGTPSPLYSDKRLIDTKEIMPRLSALDPGKIALKTSKTLFPLFEILWAVILLLFITERWLSHE